MKGDLALPDVSGLILAGGASTRMGRDKGLLELAGRPVVLWVLERLEAVAGEIAIATSPSNDADYRRIAPEGVRCVPDDVAGQGPLGGWLSGLPALHGSYVAVVPCDTPLYAPALGRLLVGRAWGHDGAVPRIGKYFEPLHGVYRREALLEATRRTIAAGLSRPVHTYAHLDIVEVREPELREADPELRSFRNANTPEDFALLRTLVATPDARP